MTLGLACSLLKRNNNKKPNQTKEILEKESKQNKQTNKK